MNYLRTAVLLAGLTALFMAIGYVIGGGSGALIALLVAAGINLASYWNADKLVLAMHDAQAVRRDQRARPLPTRAGSRAQRWAADAARLYHGQSAAQRVCDRTRPRACGSGGDHRVVADALARRSGGRHRPRARPCQKSRHADDDDHGDDRGRDFNAGAVWPVLQWAAR